MKEYLDYYDEEGKYLGTATYDEIHEKGLWHNTVHCWLYTSDAKLMFQIRANRGTFYTTASGHVIAGETIPEAFHREIKEEIGLNLDTKGATFVAIVPWQMDKVKDGKEWHDRAKANVYINLYEGDYTDFNMDPEEVSGIGVVSAQETLDLFNSPSYKFTYTLAFALSFISLPSFSLSKTQGTVETNVASFVSSSKPISSFISL